MLTAWTLLPPLPSKSLRELTIHRFSLLFTDGEDKLRLASAFTGERGLKVWILFNISLWSCSHRAVLLKQMALLSCSLKHFFQTRWISPSGLATSFHVTCTLAEIFLTSRFVMPAPSLGNIFSFSGDVPSIHMKSLSSPPCCLDERKHPWIWPFLPLTLHRILEKNHNVPEFASQINISSSVSSLCD